MSSKKIIVITVVGAIVAVILEKAGFYDAIVRRL